MINKDVYEEICCFIPGTSRCSCTFAQATPEEAQKGLQAWIDWAKKLGPALLDPGNPLTNAMSVTPTGVSKSDTKIIGMSILQAGSMDEALGMVKGHHHLGWSKGCEIVVLEEAAIPELA